MSWQNKQFQRKIENFECENCGQFIRGSGYTNHCSTCLWSKHVDINPGDRASSCRGLMEPVKLEIKGDKYTITHRCLKCGHEKRNKISPTDDMDVIIKLSAKE